MLSMDSREARFTTAWMPGQHQRDAEIGDMSRSEAKAAEFSWQPSGGAAARRC
jgi:hypothetical protein